MSRHVDHVKSFVMIFVVAAVVCLSGFVISSFARHAQADSLTGDEIRYESYVVEAGDTLWDLAERYRETPFASREDYIEEVMRVNQLTSPRIFEGDLLALPASDFAFLSASSAE